MQLASRIEDDITLADSDVERQIEEMAAWFVRKFAEASLLDLVQIVTALVLSILAVVGAFIYQRELREMRTANQLTRSALEAGDRSILATLSKMQGQVDATNTLVRYARIQSEQAVTQASAGKSVAETAAKSLRISERAYLSTGNPTLDQSGRDVSIPLFNAGRIPSGQILVTVHEATIDTQGPGVPSAFYSPLEAHWKAYPLESVIPGQAGLNIEVPVPNGNPQKINTGYEQIFLAGTIRYDDGFPEEGKMTSTFCYADFFNPILGQVVWGPCRSATYLGEMIKSDHYPANEAK
jgi:hypothetical protein